MFLDQSDCSYPVQPLIIADFVRAHHRSAPLLLIDALLYPHSHWRMPVGDSPLLSSHYACESFTVQHGDTKSAEYDSFQNRNMGSQCHRVVNSTFYVVGCSRGQHTKYVSYTHSSNNTLRFPGFVHVAVMMVREVSHRQSDH